MKSTKKGFTLVELLVVIAILAILATVSVVGYTAFIEKAHQSVAMQEMTQIRNALVAEDITNDGFDLSDGIDGSSTIVVASTEGAQGTPSEAENVLNFVQTLGIAGTYKVTGGGALQFSPEGKDATATCDFVTGEITTEKGTIACDHQWQEATCELPQTCTLCGETRGEPAGHDYDVATYVWSEDKATCTATRICKTDSAHVETETVDVVATVTQEQKCLQAELTTYTATFTNTAFETQTQADIETKPALEHQYDGDRDTSCNVCSEIRTLAPVLVDSSITQDIDVFVVNNTGIVLDFANVDNVSDLKLTYSAKRGEEEVTLDGTKHTFVFGTYSDQITTETFTVTISYTLNEVEETLTYTYTLNLKDTTDYRLENGGFENGLDGWTKVGNIGDVSSEKTYWAEAIEFGMDGDKMFSAYAQGAEEGAVGTLTSSTFTVGGSGFVTFKVGAMRDSNYVYIDVVDAETKQILARYYNGLWSEADHGGCKLVAYKANLSAFMDKEVFFRISDNADSGFGLFFVDSFITYYENEPQGFNDATPVSYKVSGTIYDLFNGGFEMGNVQGWWNNSEIGVVTNASGYWGENISYGKVGEYLFTGVESFGADTMREGNRGTLTSSAFELGGTGYISYMLGGGNELCYVQVIDATTNEVLAMYRQQAREDAVLKTYVANLSAYLGRTVRIQVVDNSTNEWGCVSFDNVVTYYPVGKALPENAIEANDINATFKYTLANGGFECKLDGWTLVRTAGETDIGYVSEQEVFWKNAEKSYNKDGRFLFTGVEDTNGLMEGGQGTLTSSRFVIGGSGYITFKLGGGYNPECYIEIVDAETDNAIAKFHNPNAESNEGRMFQFKADLSEFQGKEVYIRVVDNAVNAWGCMAVDSFVTYYETAEQLPEATLLSNLLVAE